MLRNVWWTYGTELQMAMSCAYLLTACSARRPEPDDDAPCTSARLAEGLVLACAELLHRGNLEGH
jgi:hypothetical protein